MKSTIVRLLSVVLLLSAYFVQSCKPNKDDAPTPLPQQDTTVLVETPADSATYAGLRGVWRVDSAKDAQTGKVFSHLMDTAYGLSATTNARIFVNFRDDTTVRTSSGYGRGMAGDYTVHSSVRIDFDVEWLAQDINRPKRVWDSVVAAKFNEAEMFFIKQESQEQKMTLTNSALKPILYCTKYQ